MGVRLIVEIMDHWRDAGLTKGQKDDLLTLAENANDVTRETFRSVHADYILRRVDKTAESWRNSIDALKRKSVVGYAVHNGRQMSGRPGQFAVYRIAVLCPEAPHDGYEGHCTRPKKCVISQMTHSDEMGHLSDDPSKRLGHLRDAECVTSQVTPSPPSPHNPSSSRASDAAAASDGPTDGGGGMDDPKPERQHQADALIAALPVDASTIDPPRRRKLHAGIVAALAAGWTDADLKQELLRELGNARSPVGVWLSRLKPENLSPPGRASPAASGKPPWCGVCDQRTRMVEIDFAPAYCPACHPTSQATIKENAA